MNELDNKYNVNISLIDENQSKFIDIVNKAIIAKQHNNNAENVKDVIKEMTMYALSHFVTEEANMIEFDYQDYQRHKEEHHDFSMKTIVYLNRVINGDYQIANEVLKYLNK